MKRLAALITLVFVSSGALSAPAFAQSGEQAPPKPKVTVVPVESKQVSEAEVFSGRVVPVNQVDILARVPGYVESIGFEEGGRVAKGDLLIQIEPDAYEAAITQIQGQIKSTQAAKTLADIELDRQQKLFEKDDVAENIVQKAQAQQGQVEGELLQLKGSLQNAQLNLSYTKIAAPFDGRMSFSSLSVGAYVNPGSGVLVNLASIDPIYVSFPVSETELLKFRAERSKNKGGPPLEIDLILADGTDYAHSGKVSLLDTSVQSGTDTIMIKATFPNPDGALLNDQLVRVKVVDQPQDKSLVIPTIALQRDQSGYFVLIVDDSGKVAKQEIDVARIAGTEAVVGSGLKEGDQVITEGLQRVHAGIEVDAVQKTSAKSGQDGQADTTGGNATAKED